MEARQRMAAHFAYFGKAALAADQGVKLRLEFAELAAERAGRREKYN
jgi:hypothetical protein